MKPLAAHASLRLRELAWALYDVGTPAFATMVMADFFPVFFKQYVSAGLSGDHEQDRQPQAYGEIGVEPVTGDGKPPAPSTSRRASATAPVFPTPISDPATNKPRTGFTNTFRRMMCHGLSDLALG